MSYAPPNTGWASLKSSRNLEKAMRDRDVNGSELARLADVSPQQVTNIRRGRYSVIREDTAAAIERALRQEQGNLFEYGQRVR